MPDDKESAWAWLSPALQLADVTVRTTIREGVAGIRAAYTSTRDTGDATVALARSSAVAAEDQSAAAISGALRGVKAAVNDYPEGFVGGTAICSRIALGAAPLRITALTLTATLGLSPALAAKWGSSVESASRAVSVKVRDAMESVGVPTGR